MPYILSYAYELEKLKEYELVIEPPVDTATFFRNSGERPLSELPNRIQAAS